MQKRTAFTLVELLVVMAISVVLMTASAVAFNSIFVSSKFNQALSNIPLTLENARQYAVANNTYVWVAFHQTSNANELPKVAVVCFASKDGTDPSNGFQNSTISVPATQYVFLSKAETLAQIALEPAGQNRWTGLPAVPQASTVASLAAVQFSVNLASLGGTQVFEQAVQFGPTGEARVAAGLSSLIEVGITPLSGSGVRKTADRAVVRISSLTGLARLYRS